MLKEWLLSEARKDLPVSLRFKHLLIARWMHCTPWDLEEQAEEWRDWAAMLMEVMEEVAPVLAAIEEWRRKAREGV